MSDCVCVCLLLVLSGQFSQHGAQFLSFVVAIVTILETI